MKPALLALALVAITAAAPASAQPAEPPPPVQREWLGLELSPAWLNANAAPDFGDDDGKAPKHGSLGFAGTLRLLRFWRDDYYVTPFQFGGGGGVAGAETILVHLSAEGGFRLPAAHPRVELGLAIGLGVVIIPYSTHCDGTCWVGGSPLVLSPVARLVLANSQRWFAALFARAVVPPVRPSDPSSQNHGFGMSVLGGLDLALKRL